MRMNRKSQFYLFAAIVLIVSSFVIYSSSSTLSAREVDEFKTYLDNYLYEARVVMNNAIYNNLNVSTTLSNFTEHFISYARNKDLDIGIAFIYSENSKLHIVNYLNQPLLISSIGLA